MSNVYEAAKPTDEPAAAPAKSGCGCWVWGCLTVLLVGGLVLGITGYLAYRWGAEQRDKYFSTTPAELPVVEYEEDKFTALETRVEDFKTSLNTDQPTEDLVLSEDDINALINGNEDLRGKIYVELEEGQIKGDVSFPTDGIPFLGGRYFNASASLEASIVNGNLIVNMTDAEVKGEQVPAEVMTELKRENLAKDLFRDPESQKALSRIDSIEIQEGQITLRINNEGIESAEESGEEKAEGDAAAGDAAEGDAAAGDADAGAGAGADAGADEAAELESAGAF